MKCEQVKTVFQQIKEDVDISENMLVCCLNESQREKKSEVKKIVLATSPKILCLHDKSWQINH